LQALAINPAKTMKTWKGLMLTLAICMVATNSFAQIIVNVRPNRPVYSKTAAPSPWQVWIEEELEPKGTSYIFAGGRWA
jgi:hypothetical protein